MKTFVYVVVAMACLVLTATGVWVYSTEIKSSDVGVPKVSEVKAERPRKMLLPRAAYEPETLTLIEDIDALMDTSDCVIMGKIDSIDGVTNKSKSEGYVFAATLATINVEHIYECARDDIAVGSKVKLAKTGGVISVEEYEKGLNDGEKYKRGFSKMTVEQKKSTYITELVPYDINFEAGQMFLLFLYYSDFFEGYPYAVRGLDWGIWEFNAQDETVKVNTSGEWESLESLGLER